MIAGLVTRPVLASFARQWPIFLAVTLSTLLASGALGWLLSRRRLLPGTTAIWGLSPGAATAMMLMAEAHGGDPRLVAFMQYLRVICVAFLASLIARFWIGSTGTIRSDQVYFPALRLVPLAETLAIAGFGMTLARWIKIPSGTLFVPMVAGSILHASGVVEIEMPRWLLVGTFAVLGWGIGLQFTRSGLAHAARSFPLILASIVEKETALPEERRHIASVFIKRLKIGMRLQTDPTVIYGLTGGYPLGRGIRQSELEGATPYNTYVIAGLPPGPICNPGKDSIAAVLNPQASDDLYFVATGHGGHVFAPSIAEQARNVAAYRAFERKSQAPQGQRVEAMPENTTVTVLDSTVPKLPPVARRKSTRHR